MAFQSAASLKVLLKIFKPVSSRLALASLDPTTFGKGAKEKSTILPASKKVASFDNTLHMLSWNL